MKQQALLVFFMCFIISCSKQEDNPLANTKWQVLPDDINPAFNPIKYEQFTKNEMTQFLQNQGDTCYIGLMNPYSVNGNYILVNDAEPGIIFTIHGDTLIQGENDDRLRLVRVPFDEALLECDI